MNDAIRRAADVQSTPKSRSYQLVAEGWQGPTVIPIDGDRPPLMDYSTWICPHDPHCGHYTPCLQKHRSAR